MLRELCSQNGEANLAFREVRSSDFNEHVLRAVRYLRGIRVDNRRQGEDGTLGIVEDWVAWGILDDVQILLQHLVVLEDLE